MFAAAAAAGVTMTLASGYRSYATQIATYNGYVSARGQAAADTASARPGYSEHQTGWAFDIGDGGGACSFQPCFAEQPAAVWAKANAHRFGFVVRYPWMLHPITGYYYESWHLRYIGVEAATDMKKRGIATLEEYFGLEAAPGYPLHGRAHPVPAVSSLVRMLTGFKKFILKGNVIDLAVAVVIGAAFSSVVDALVEERH